MNHNNGILDQHLHIPMGLFVRARIDLGQTDNIHGRSYQYDFGSRKGASERPSKCSRGEKLKAEERTSMDRTNTEAQLEKPRYKGLVEYTICERFEETENIQM